MAVSDVCSSAQEFRLPPETMRKALKVNITAFIGAFQASPVGRGQRKSVPTSGIIGAMRTANFCC